jgi:hypothetical protein
MLGRVAKLGERGDVMAESEAEAERGGARRRNGSTLVGIVSGVALTALAALLLGVFFGCLTMPAPLCRQMTRGSPEVALDAVCCLIFAVILVWWAVSSSAGLRKPLFNDRGWGIGEPTVTMVITVVTAVVAIIALLHELFKPG